MTFWDRNKSSWEVLDTEEDADQGFFNQSKRLLDAFHKKDALGFAWAALYMLYFGLRIAKQFEG